MEAMLHDVSTSSLKTGHVHPVSSESIKTSPLHCCGPPQAPRAAGRTSEETSPTGYETAVPEK